MKAVDKYFSLVPIVLFSSLGLFFAISSIYENEQGDYFSPGKNYTVNGHVSSNGINICESNSSCTFKPWTSFEYCNILKPLWHALNMTFIMSCLVCARMTQKFWSHDYRFSIWFLILPSLGVTQIGYFIFFAIWYGKCVNFIRSSFPIDINPNSAILLPYFLGVMTPSLSFFAHVYRCAMKRRYEEEQSTSSVDLIIYEESSS